MIGAVILAAGRGSRLGGVAKALIEQDGVSFLERIVRCCREAGAGRLAVVVAEPFARAVADKATELGVEVAVNPRPERGMGSSVAVGFSHAGGWSESIAALLWPVDHPWVRVETVSALVARAHPGAIVIPVAGDRGGHPALVGREVWPELTRCGDVEGGAREVFRHNRERQIRVAVDDLGVIRDVDTPADL